MKSIFYFSTLIITYCVITFPNPLIGQSTKTSDLPNINFCFVEATEIEENSVVQVNWAYPNYLYYDDGEWDNILAFDNAGSECVVKFIGQQNSSIVGVEVNVGDGSYPSGNNFLGKDFTLVVYSFNRLTNSPGILLGSTNVTVDNYGWVKVKDLDIVVNDSIYYVGIKQLFGLLSATPVAYNTDAPVHNLSYTKQAEASKWNLFNGADLMIRVHSCSEQNDAKKSNPEIIVSRASDFDPIIGETPNDGVITILDSIYEPTDYFTDNLFGELTSGYYAYGLKKYNSDNSTYNDWNFSNNLLNTVGIDEFNSNDNMFTMYPNPASNEITINLTDKLLSRNTTIEIIDLNGKTVKRSTTSESSVCLNIEKLAKGYFIVKVWNNDHLFTESLLIK